MRISDWSSDVCSSDLRDLFRERAQRARHRWRPVSLAVSFGSTEAVLQCVDAVFAAPAAQDGVLFGEAEIRHRAKRVGEARSEEHTSELQSLMRRSAAVFCLEKNKSSTKLNLHNDIATTQVTATN